MPEPKIRIDLSDDAYHWSPGDDDDDDDVYRRPSDDEIWDRVFLPTGEPMYYNRGGAPCSLRQWSRDFENLKVRFVARDYVLGAWVATIWDGINHQLFESVPALIFETTVFRKDRFGRRRAGRGPRHCRGWTGRELPNYLDGYQIRYASEREALEGHWMTRKWARAIQQIENGPPPLWPGSLVKRKKRKRR